MTADAPHALVELRGHTLVITMNRPERKNALTGEMLQILADAWDRIDEDPQIRSAVLTGAGGAFCAGADLKNMASSDPGAAMSGGGWDPARIPGLIKGRRPSKPLIAAVEGAAIAGGTELLAGTDIRVAAQSATFGVSEARWSLYPMGGSAVRLPRQIPYTVAADLLLTGRHITAAEAKEYGLIGHLVPDGTALNKAMELAESINANGPLAVQAVLRTMRATEGMSEDDAFTIDAQNGLPVFGSHDAKEGPRAFTEKRTPVFEGR
ncbi:crotonase/enoyl-CoA hydratase family protein [Tsukamurella serpentis]